jgi:hypothetical protein
MNKLKVRSLTGYLEIQKRYAQFSLVNENEFMVN